MATGLVRALREKHWSHRPAAVLRELFLDVKGHRATSNHAARWKSEATNFT